MVNLDFLYNGTLNIQSMNSTVPTDNDSGLPLQHIRAILERQYTDHFLLALNIGALLFFVVDKYQARNGGWRVRELFLYICCVTAPIASILGMLVVWHKVRKPSYYLTDLIGLFLMYQSYGFLAADNLTWWKVIGLVNLGLAFLSLLCKC